MGIYDRDYMRRRESPSISVGTLLAIVAAIAILLGTTIHFASGGHSVATSEPTEQQRSHATPIRPINVNTATADELASIPYLSSDAKHAILEHRPYATPEDLMTVPGIKKRMLERIRPYVTVN